MQESINHVNYYIDNDDVQNETIENVEDDTEGEEILQEQEVVKEDLKVKKKSKLNIIKLKTK